VVGQVESEIISRLLSITINRTIGGIVAIVRCEVIEDTETNDYGYDSVCVRATCSKCGHETMSFGDSEASVARCLAIMREECPRSEKNYYVEDEV